MLNDSTLNILLTTLPEKTILVIEDIGTIFKSKEEINSSSRITFGGLLNILDGISSKDGRILFITTNDIDNLSSALLRPGRIDVKFKFDYCNPYQIQKISERILNNEKLSIELTKLISDFSFLTPAQLQGYLLKYRNNLDEILLNYKELISI
jgi:mitochondrial chaperone BCS1